MGTGHLSNKIQLYLLHHLLVNLHQRTEVSSGIRIRRTSELDLFNLRVVWHNGPSGPLLVLSVVGTTHERVIIAPWVASTAPRGATSQIGGGANHLYAITSRQEKENSPDVVTGASLSVVTLYIAMIFNILPEKLLEPLSVSTPVGESILADRVYRDCTISINHRDTMYDLVELDMVDFDVILDDLPGVPPKREINFGIDILPDTRPIYIPPYRMSLAELNELKEQLKDLLNKGFIQPSVLTWGAPVLFVRKKDGSITMCIH
ncbi:hypothetical protein KY285_010689 [Solanum tuberosum]|nr:hypothetical protein KY289_011246 [Solanum tuberosum]KAH0734982.1 hypothetical protein KY285_010689 [Solanum tuberosum]